MYVKSVSIHHNILCSKVCKPEVHPETETSWAPCGHSFTDEDYWLDVMFERPVVPAAVVIYIASDGQTKYSEIVKTVEVTHEHNTLAPGKGHSLTAVGWSEMGEITFRINESNTT